MKIKDAEEKLSECKILLKESKYAGALLALQQCLELSVKALLDEVGISYISKKGKPTHDVSNKLPGAFQKIKEMLKLAKYEEERYRKGLAKAGFLLTFLTAIRNYLAYGFENLANIVEILGNFEDVKKFTETSLSFGEESFLIIKEIISKLKGPENKKS